MLPGLHTVADERFGCIKILIRRYIAMDLKITRVPDNEQYYRYSKVELKKFKRCVSINMNIIVMFTFKRSNF